MIKLKALKLPIFVFLIIFLIGLGFYTTWRTHDNSTDFDTYYFAAKEALSGASVYAPHKDVSPYIYPPFFACLIAPLAFFSMETASTIWYLLNIIFSFLCLYLCFSFISGDKKISDRLGEIALVPKFLALVVISALLLDNISMLQVNIMIVFLVLASLYFFRKKNDILTGLFLAMAVSIKIVPVLFLVYFAVKREFKVCLFTVLGLALFSFAVPSFYLGFESAVGGMVAWVNSMLLNAISSTPNHDTIVVLFNPENQSITAFFSRWLVKNDFLIIHLKRMAHEFPPFLICWTFNLGRASAFWASRAIVFLLLSVSFFLCRAKIKDRMSGQLNFEWALIFLAALIANPILRTHQMVLLLFPLILALFRLAERGKYYRLLYSVFLSICFLYLLQAGRLFKIVGSGTFSILCLWAFLVISYRRRFFSSAL